MMSISRRNRALLLLAGQSNGVPQAVMRTAYRFTAEQLDELVKAGLVAKKMRRVSRSGPRPFMAVWLTITDAGHDARKARQA